MITPSSLFATANAALQKKPLYVLAIEGYKRAFSNAAVGAVRAPLSSPVVQYATFFHDFGGPGPIFATFTGANTAGNILFAIYFGTMAATSLDDTAGNTWTQIYNTTWNSVPIQIWTATAVSAAAGNVVELNGGASMLSGFDFYIIEVPAKYASFTYGAATGTTPTAATSTVGANSVQIPIDHGSGSAWGIFQIALEQATTLTTGINLVFAFSFGVVQSTWARFPGIVDYAPSGSDALVYTAETSTNDWLVSLDDLKISISDLDGSSNLADLVFNVQDRSQQLTADLASFVFEGKACWLMAGFQGVAIEDWIDGYNGTRLFTGVISLVESDNGNLEYKFTVTPKNTTKLTQAIYTQSDADSNGNTFAVDSNHPRTVSGHPLDILVSALTQCGVDANDIDTAKIDYYRDTIFNGLSYKFSLTQAPVAKDFIENELMKPMGMYLWENNLGTITINSFYPALSGDGTYTPPSYPQSTLDTTNITKVPIEQQADLIDQTTFRFDDNGNGFDSETINTWNVAVAKYGLYGPQIIESKGMRSGFQGFFMASIISRLMFNRYGSKQIILDPLPLLWSMCVLEPGDIVQVTLAYIPDRNAGVMGVTTKTFEVMDRNWRLMDGITEVKLLELDLSAFKQYLITPNAETDFTLDTPTNQGKYMYLSDANGVYSDASSGNTLG